VAAEPGATARPGPHRNHQRRRRERWPLPRGQPVASHPPITSGLGHTLHDMSRKQEPGRETAPGRQAARPAMAARRRPTRSPSHRGLPSPPPGYPPCVPPTMGRTAKSSDHRNEPVKGDRKTARAAHLRSGHDRRQRPETPRRTTPQIAPWTTSANRARQHMTNRPFSMPDVFGAGHSTRGAYLRGMKLRAFFNARRRRRHARKGLTAADAAEAERRREQWRNSHRDAAHKLTRDNPDSSWPG
jgi:hypothetical protein